MSLLSQLRFVVCKVVTCGVKNKYVTRKGENLLGVLVCTGGTVCIICSVYSKRAKAYRLYVGWYVWG